MNKLAVVANIIFATLITAVVTLQALNDRNQVIEGAYADTGNLARSLAEHTGETFSALDFVLASIGDVLVEEPDMGPEVLSELLRARRDASVTVHALHVIGPDGRIVASSTLADLSSYEFSDYPAFATLRDTDMNGLYLGPPHRREEKGMPDQWVVTLSRRIDRPDGSFGGTVAAGLALSRLTGVYEALNLGKDGLVSMVSAEGVMIARFPLAEEHLGRNLSGNWLESEVFGPRLIEADESLDGIERFAAAHRDPVSGGVIVVGAGRDATLADWRRRTMFSALIAVLTILLFVVVSAVMMSHARRRTAWQQQEAERLRTLAQASRELATCPDESHLLARVTRTARELIGAHQAATGLSCQEPGDVLAVDLSDRYARWHDDEDSPHDPAIHRLVCETNQPLCLSQHELNNHPARRDFIAASDSQPAMNGCLAVPVMASDGTNLGAIQLSDKHAGEFDENDLSELQQLAAITGVALENLRTHAALREAVDDANSAREEIETIFASISDGVLALGRDWRVLFMNHEAERLLQRSFSDLAGKDIWEEFPAGRGEGFEAHYRKAMETGSAVAFTSWFEPLRSWFEVTAYPHEKGLTIYFHDVTLRLEAEERLRQAQKMEAVGQLTGGVAHDFNNLLTVILGSAEVVLDDTRGLPDDVRIHVGTVQRAGERAAALTHRLLAFARKQPLEPRPINANELVLDFEEILRRTLGAGIDLETIRGAGLWAAAADPNELQNAILNLAINARDAMPEGGRLTIETANASVDDEYARQHDLKPGQYVMIGVSDTGTGMDQEVRARAFDPFFTTKEVGKGSGLGLSMVYGFVRQSRGHVGIYSEPGEGTTIRLYLPRTQGEAPSERLAREVQPSSDDGRHHILLVEDDELVRQFTTDCLHSLGYRVTACADGAEALGCLEAGETFDLLLTDVVLPNGMPGRQVAEKAGVLRPDLPVLFMSGYTENAIVHHGRLDAGVLLLSKPFRRAELAAKVRQAMERGVRHE